MCIGGSGACPPEECGGPHECLERRDEADGHDAWRDTGIMTDFIEDIVAAEVPGRQVSDFMSYDVEAAMELRTGADSPRSRSSGCPACSTCQIPSPAKMQIPNQAHFETAFHRCWRKMPLQRAVTATIPVPTHKTDLPGVSCGFRPGRGMHDASDALAVGKERRKAGWIVDANRHGCLE